MIQLNIRSLTGGPQVEPISAVISVAEYEEIQNVVKGTFTDSFQRAVEFEKSAKKASQELNKATEQLAAIRKRADRIDSEKNDVIIRQSAELVRIQKENIYLRDKSSRLFIALGTLACIFIIAFWGNSTYKNSDCRFETVAGIVK